MSVYNIDLPTSKVIKDSKSLIEYFEYIRTEYRKADDRPSKILREWNALMHFMYWNCLSDEGGFENLYPLEIEKTERPDFCVKFNDKSTIKIEVVRIISQNLANLLELGYKAEDEVRLIIAAIILSDNRILSPEELQEYILHPGESDKQYPIYGSPMLTKWAELAHYFIDKKIKKGYTTDILLLDDHFLSGQSQDDINIQTSKLSELLDETPLYPTFSSIISVNKAGILILYHNQEWVFKLYEEDVSNIVS